MKKFAKFIIINLLFLNQVFSQKNNFENEIIEFEKSDSLNFPKKGANLFVGSSSIRFWQFIESDFEHYSVVRRGFGGSNLLDLAYFTERIIIKYEPVKIFIYTGENDIAEGVTAEEALERFQKVFFKIRNALPLSKIAYISIKPSILRKEQFKSQTIANQLIKKFLKGKASAEFINIVPKMMLRGKPNPSIFLADKLHMNRKGYEIWSKKIRKYLVK
jgi:hypothetical protein